MRLRSVRGPATRGEKLDFIYFSTVSKYDGSTRKYSGSIRENEGYKGV